MRSYFAAPLLALTLAVSGCAPSIVRSPAVPGLAGAVGTSVSGKLAKSPGSTTALSVACANAAPILDRYAATAFPAAAPFIPAAEAAFSSFCQGALPAGYSTTSAASKVNFLFAVVLGSHIMDVL